MAVQFPAGERGICLLHNTQKGSVAHPLSYSVRTDSKAAGREVHHIGVPHFSPQNKNEWSYTSMPNTHFWRPQTTVAFLLCLPNSNSTQYLFITKNSP
jgi:hypothetical protein